MFCYQCGNALGAADRYCNRCGAAALTAGWEHSYASQATPSGPQPEGAAGSEKKPRWLLIYAGAVVFLAVALAALLVRDIARKHYARTAVLPFRSADTSGALEAPAAGLPRLGDHVYVEELPEPIRKVAPAYPLAARKAGVSGTVIVQALVDKQGRVRDTRVMKSVPMLDAAAVAAVRRWVFKPARARGQPVAVWVAVPVRFTLH